MKEYIERDYLVKEAEAILMFRKQFRMSKERIEDAAATLEWLKYYAPAADVVEVRHAKWEAWMPDKNGETREFICTGCRFMVEMNWKQKECDYEWCPYCGCKMDREE